MSFILNALRKSEQERQALQPETVTDRILLPQPQQRHSKTTKILAFLVIANVLVIGYIVWFVRNGSTPTPVVTTPAISKPLSVPETKLEPKTHPERPPQKAESETASIAELIEGEKREPAPLPAKPVITKKPEADTIKQPAIVNKPALPIPTIPATAAVVKAQPAAPDAVPEQKDIPYLNDLSFEFRQTVPKLNINVFVYSQQPEERFVMIDMVKYKQGQQMKDAMLLKEIHPDGLVIDYKNQIFKIKRP
ncbi:MAG: general secretion pathway protein GspB [Methylobacter sp.]|nr:general secretion pathway protein GspB [Methylobacter sp.]